MSEKCPRCQSERISIITRQSDRSCVYCLECFVIFTPNQQREIESLRRESKILAIKCNNSLANNLCPDHRDKQAGKPCLACEIESLRAKIESQRERIVYLEGATNHATGTPLSKAEAKLQKAVEGLERLEWIYQDKKFGNTFCPVCHNHKNISGHTSMCWLAALLKEVKG